MPVHRGKLINLNVPVRELLVKLGLNTGDFCPVLVLCVTHNACVGTALGSSPGLKAPFQFECFKPPFLMFGMEIPNVLWPEVLENCELYSRTVLSFGLLTHMADCGAVLMQTTTCKHGV